jgi:hypothetical protein
MAVIHKKLTNLPNGRNSLKLINPNFAISQKPFKDQHDKQSKSIHSHMRLQWRRIHQRRHRQRNSSNPRGYRNNSNR